MHKFSWAAISVLLVSANVVCAADATEQKQPLDRRAPDYMRCVRVLETGSLVKKSKICHTNADWNRINEQQKNEAGGLIQRNNTGLNPSG